MKKYTYILVVLLLLTSCKKFLDVRPQAQIDKDDLLNTEQGFKEALNGVYTLCASEALYGGNLTFGNLDVLAQNYQFSDVIYQNIARFNYQSPEVVNTNAQVWSTAYQAIANCNYILSAIEDKKAVFTGSNYALIKGETLTLRAYLHFDLLRMFAPSYKNSPAAVAIPYVTQVSTRSTPFSTVTEVIDKVLADLNEAKSIIKRADPFVLSGYVVGYPGVAGTTEAANPDLFMQNRRHRMNYFAICGELARVYLYKNDLANSLLYAEEVIDSERFPFTDESDYFQSDLAKRDRIFYKELVMAWYIDNKATNDRLRDVFSRTSALYSPTDQQRGEIFELAGPGADDWRYRQMFLTASSPTGGPDRALLQKYVKNAAPLPNLHPQVAPAIRLSEMYYIAAEAVYDTDPQKAMEYFQTVREHRGIGTTPADINSKDDFIDLLIKEARKEFYGEGQIFYMYKRLNHAVVISPIQSRPPSNQIFVFPIPDNEQAYRNN